MKPNQLRYFSRARAGARCSKTGKQRAKGYPFVIITCCCIAILVGSSAPEAESQKAPANECGALRSAFEQWIASYEKRDLAGTMSIFADDVNFSFQGAPDWKKADLEKSYRDEFAHPEQTRRWIPKFEEFQCSGNLGFVRSTWRLEVTSSDGKMEIKAENRSVDILRLSEDGTWKIFRSLNYPIVAPKKMTTINGPDCDHDQDTSRLWCTPSREINATLI